MTSWGCGGEMRDIAPSNICPRKSPRKGRRRPTPRFCAVGANGTNTRKDSLATVQIKPDIFTLPRRASAEVLISC
jgi:hypothetical protein